MTSTYIDAIAYTKAATGLTLAPLYGNIGRIAACAAGATSLTLIQPLTGATLNQYDDLYLFDGPSSEVLHVGAGGAAAGATSIPLQAATQYVHSGGQAYCTDGTQGSLGQALFEASRWLEDICYQSLWQATYTSEVVAMPTMRAAIDNQGGLNIRPLHFPVTSLSSLSVATSDSSSAIDYDPTEAQIDSLQRLVSVPVLKPLNSGQQSLTSQFSPSLSRSQKAWLSITYTAGFATSTLPWTVTRAAMLLTNEMLAQTANPIGADSISQGKRSVAFVIRGDTSGDSLLVKQAKQLLGRYSARLY